VVDADLTDILSCFVDIDAVKIPASTSEHECPKTVQAVLIDSR